MRLTFKWRGPWKLGYFPGAVDDEHFSVETHLFAIGPVQIRWYRWIKNRYSN